MASTATEKRSSPARRARPATKTNAGGEARKAASKAVKSGSSPAPSRIVRKVAKKAMKVVARKTLHAGGEAIRMAAERAAGTGRDVLEVGVRSRPPIQCSVDIAAPINVAWQEWVTLGWLPEGVDRIVNIERDGDTLFGETSGRRSVQWEAEVVDERKDESFAWRSVEGTDCAGLVTFHRLSERLTRVELDLDVLPINPKQTVTIGTNLAARRAVADLRRFKAHVEFISPDAYDTDAKESGDDSDGENEGE